MQHSRYPTETKPSLEDDNVVDCKLDLSDYDNFDDDYIFTTYLKYRPPTVAPLSASATLTTKVFIDMVDSEDDPEITISSCSSSPSRSPSSPAPLVASAPLPVIEHERQEPVVLVWREAHLVLPSDLQDDLGDIPISFPQEEQVQASEQAPTTGSDTGSLNEASLAPLSFPDPVVDPMDFSFLFSDMNLAPEQTPETISDTLMQNDAAFAFVDANENDGATGLPSDASNATPIKRRRNSITTTTTTTARKAWGPQRRQGRRRSTQQNMYE